MNQLRNSLIAVLGFLVLGATVVHAQTSELAPETLYHNGKIVTVNESFDIAEALMVRDGRIVAVGSDAELERLADSDTRMVDLNGQTVLPGFYDNHVHIGVGQDPSIQDWSHIETSEELIEALKERVREVPEGEWIQAGLSTERLTEQELPRKEALDEVAPNHPVALERMHVMIVNSMALEKAEITKETPEPSGGQIGRYSNGEPNGLLRETPAQRLVTRVIPDWTPDDSTARQNIRSDLAALPQLGITSLNIAGMQPHTLQWLQGAYERWQDELPRSTVQVRIRPGYDAYDDIDRAINEELALIEDLRFHTNFGDDQLKLGAIKMSIDGGMTGQAGWMLEPYEGRPDYHGTVRIPERALYQVGKKAHELGWQLGIHAIGDAAVQSAVDALDRILQESPRSDHRHFIHHIEVKPPEQTLETMADRNIIAAMQPNFTYSLASYYQAAMDEGERIETVNPQTSLLDKGIRMSFGSDGLPLGPLVGLYGAVVRRGEDGKVYGPDERVSIEQAIRFYTMESAFMNFEEQDRGSLEVGKLADMVVLSEDILTIDPERLLDVEVEKTIIGGEVVYSRSE